VNTIPSGLGAHVDHRIAFACRFRIKNLIFANQAERECIHQRIARVAGLEFSFAAQIRHPETVSVRSNTAYDAFKNGVIAVNFGRRGRDIAVRVGQEFPTPTS